MKNTVMKQVVRALCASIFGFMTTACFGAKSDLRVLYVGDHPERIEESPSANNIYRDEQGQIPKWHRNRTSSFERLLLQHFADVAVVYSDEYKESISENYDVTIFGDLPVPLKEGVTEMDENGDVVRFENPQYLSPDFDKASILIGFVSPVIGEPLELKMDWLCLCLYAQAHNLEVDHSIFNYPNKVELTITPQPTPESYRHYYNGRKLTGSIPMWQVQTGYAAESGFQPGMVSSAEGFADAPDGEIIAAGVNTKSVSSVALARHGNYFHWGFSASPEAMTDEAKLVFVNAIHYIAKYDGQATYSRRPYRSRTRESTLDIAYAAYQDKYDKYVESQLQGFESQKKFIEKKRKQGKKISFADRQIMAKKAPDILPEGEWLIEKVQSSFPEQLVGVFGTDRGAYLKYYEENLEYLIPGADKYKYLADADAKSMGIANRDPKILDVAIGLLEKDANNSRARRVLERYTDESFDSVPKWRKWYDRNAGRLYFSDLDGHRFKVAPVSVRKQ